MEKIPFSKKELEKIGTNGTCSKLNTPITPKENLLRAIRHQNPLWVPLRSDEVNFLPRVIPDNVARAFVVEAVPYKGLLSRKDLFRVQWKFLPEQG